MHGSTRSCPSSFIVVVLLKIILILLPLGAQGIAQSEEDQRAWLRTLDSLSNERMLADVTTLSSPAFNGRQAGSEDDLRSAQWFARELTSVGVTLPLIYNTPLIFPFPIDRPLFGLICAASKSSSADWSMLATSKFSWAQVLSPTTLWPANSLWKISLA